MHNCYKDDDKFNQAGLGCKARVLGRYAPMTQGAERGIHLHGAKQHRQRDFHNENKNRPENLVLILPKGSSYPWLTKSRRIPR